MTGNQKENPYAAPQSGSDPTASPPHIEVPRERLGPEDLIMRDAANREYGFKQGAKRLKLAFFGGVAATALLFGYLHKPISSFLTNAEDGLDNILGKGEGVDEPKNISEVKAPQQESASEDAGNKWQDVELSRRAQQDKLSARE